ncbi:MAG: DUF4340 domain-containing protein [Thiogranum sp.]|nr:DUF4340 domain-containing protein [Thiogranum sp.]
MKSRWIMNLLLLVGIVALGLVARYEPGIEAPTETQAITTLRVDDVHRMHVNRPLRDDLVLVRRSPGNWIIDRPAPLPAEDFKIRALARLAEQKPVRSYPAADMDLATLQLSPPYATIFLNDTPVEFGNLEPIDDLRYVRVGERVHLIPDNYLPLMESSFTQFVRDRLLDKDARVEAIRLPDLSLSRTEQGWQMDPDQGLSAAVLQQFVDIWQDASALNVQAANPEQSGDAIEIRLKGKETPVRLQIISRKPELVLVRPDYGIQYRMGNRSEAMLTLDAAKADVED